MDTEDSYRQLLERVSGIYRTGLTELSPTHRNQRMLDMHWRAGQQIVAVDLSAALEDSVSLRQLAYSRQFYNEYEIMHVSAQLTRTHYRTLLGVKNRQERVRLERLAIDTGMSNAALAQCGHRGTVTFQTDFLDSWIGWTVS